jgi:osmotically-inducible protein OsmY
MKPMISDKALRDAVLKELESDPAVIEKHIWVTAVDGAVTLGGHVTTIHDKHVAVRAAERIDAVRAIADDIEVRPSSLHERADDEIAEEIAHLRSWHPQIPDSVAAQVRDARVILHGQVESAAERDAAESAVHRLTGVRVVDNLIEVTSKNEATADDTEGLLRTTITADRSAATSGEEAVAMMTTKHEIVRMLRNAGLPHVADEAERFLHDELDIERAADFGARYGITRDGLISRMGGSP